MAWLTTEGAAHQFTDGDTIVGSGDHAAWRLVSHDLVARHFVITSHGNRVSICSASVEAVVAVNSRQIGSTPVALHDGDTIDAGSARFFYTTSQSGAVQAAKVLPAHLVETRGGIVHPLTEQSVGIGRDRSNPIVVRDPTASRFHAEIRREAGGYVLHPHGSSGTVVNGRRSGTPERLEEGDRIEIANVEMRFVNGEPPADAPRPAVRTSSAEASLRRTILQSTVIVVPKEGDSRSNAWIWGLLVVVLAVTLFLALK